MRYNDFSVRIPLHNEVAGGYVVIDHGTKYTIRIANFRNVPCDAEVEVDGKDCGTFRLRAYGSLSLERPGHDHGRFTAYVVDSPDARAAGINPSDPETGLIKVTFTPEKLKTPVQRQWVTPDQGQPKTLNAAPTRGGEKSFTPEYAVAGAAVGTGLSGHSNQSFVDVPPLDYDYSQRTTINLRLTGPRSEGPRPLTSHSTPVPPPVGVE